MADQGFTIWFTGLSGAGKSTLAQALARRFEEHGRNVEILCVHLPPWRNNIA